MEHKGIQDNDIKNLDKRILNAEKKTVQNKKMLTDTKSKEYSKGMNIIIQFAGTILLFTFIGYSLDIYFNLLPIFLLVFVSAGFFISIYNIWRLTNKNFEEFKND